MRLITAFILAMFLLPLSFAHGQEVSDYDRFDLGNDCRPVKLVVEGLQTNAAEFNLREEDIETTVRSRLRGARIYTENTLYPDGTVTPYLYVNVNTVGSAFNINIQLNKWVSDPASNQEGLAATWGTNLTGTHGNDLNYILSSVARITDIFIDEYLRVNEAACS